MRVSPGAAVILGTLVAMFLFLFFVYAALMPAPSSARSPLDRVRFLAEAEDEVRAELLDPESARFRHDRVSTFRSIPVACGEVNFRNAAGGYAGFERFVSGTTVRAVESFIGRDDMDRLWLVMCGDER